MKSLLTFLAISAGVNAHLHSRQHYEKAFFEWMVEHGVQIPSGPDFVQRLNIFSDNSDMIELHNQGNHSYTLGHNRFSHLTFEEVQEKYLGWQRPLREGANLQQSTIMRRLAEFDQESGALPSSVDWVEKGAVTSVKDQGACGSCYTFSAAGALEGAHYVTFGGLVDLSEQQVVDCDNMDGGCKGGEMTNVFDWVKHNGGLCSLEDYPYESGTTEQKGKCSRKCQVVKGTAPTSWDIVTPNHEPSLLKALSRQPVAVAVAASKDWMFYKEGIFSGKCEAELNHGVLAVGYGENSDGKYWKVKNSWGTKWGVDGFIYLPRTTNEAACGILEDASYPLLTTKEVESKGSATAKDCGGATATFDTITLEPEDVSKNELITLKASGVLVKPTTKGTYTLDVKYAGTTLYSHTGNVCGNEKVELPLNVGVVNLYGLTCPADPGPITYGLDVTLPSIAPSGTYDIRLTAKDQDNVPLICIDAILSL